MCPLVLPQGHAPGFNVAVIGGNLSEPQHGLLADDRVPAEIGPWLGKVGSHRIVGHLVVSRDRMSEVDDRLDPALLGEAPRNCQDACQCGQPKTEYRHVTSPAI